jgi:hypothetical protein
VLDQVDRQLQHFGPGQMATAVVARSVVASDHIQVALAGHPAPVMGTTTDRGRYLDLAVGPPLGVARPGRVRRRWSCPRVP